MSVSVKTKFYSSVLRYTCNNNNGNGGTSTKNPPEVLIQLPLRRPKPNHKTPILTHQEPPVLTHQTQHIKLTDIARNCGTKLKNKSTSSDVLRLMDSLGLPTPPDMYASLMKECTLSRDSIRAIELHSHLSRRRHKLSLTMFKRLLLMHVSCGHLETARQLLDEMTVRAEFFDFESWAILVIGYLESAQYEEAVSLFTKLIHHCDHVFQSPQWFITCIRMACIDETLLAHCLFCINSLELRTIVYGVGLCELHCWQRIKLDLLMELAHGKI
ncbi:hypothetical protein K2173_018937 [Erythroxylum novogranatense]|uniref:Pentatricopeptide repeat-containing protein n=1 Tax=Erythroxylum novogranatense TaxID=1862640 RepID=A0AAV8ST51_9ROSI|nr:hypothetical protein K2173_018937 [Erythroxylum novogranatense]